MNPHKGFFMTVLFSAMVNMTLFQMNLKVTQVVLQIKVFYLTNTQAHPIRFNNKNTVV